MNDEERQERDESREHYFAQAAAIFRRMLRTGKPVAFEDAAKCIVTDDWFDRRAFGPAVVTPMNRDGEIIKAGFRESETAKHNCGIKRLWLLASTNGKGAAQ